MSISPSLSSRHYLDHYAFSSGQNLPDKEFHYLRTVIVRVVVHWGFGHQLPCHQLPDPVIVTPFVRRHPFSRSYGAILPSSLKRVVSCL
ncbi:hypothetical protein J1N35_034570 [Gossypium stocksii]|uniref:Uncharacterized protein n=1 Tax=Gossypium stocksii TaxID=47602 RepID=A0A9D3USA0_9ROSI|nr:hypothetical protein J1N35_034570 [Gossypium stocksii]